MADDPKYAAALSLAKEHLTRRFTRCADRPSILSLSFAKTSSDYPTRSGASDPRPRH
jgi:hypothetical protein